MDDRATQLVLQGRIELRSDVTVYEVKGFSGNEYFVVVRDEDPVGCTCPASKYDRESCYVKEGVREFFRMQDMLEFENDSVEYGL